MVLSNPNLHVYLNAHKSGNSTDESSGVGADKNSTTGNPSDLNTEKPHGISTISFIAVFCLGFLAVVIFYGWKKGKRLRVPKTYKYSVLNQFDAEPDDDILDFGQGSGEAGRNVINGVESGQSDEDEDVTFDRRMLDEDSSIFLGQPITNINSADLIQANTVTFPTQLNSNGRTMSAVLDSDEELLK